MKRTKASVDYSKATRAATTCAKCEHFYHDPYSTTPLTGRCHKVEGKIDPKFWCKLWSRK